MRVHQLLCLELFSFVRDTQKVNATHALARIKWAIERAVRAICDFNSPERRALDNMGFASVILTGPTGQEGVVCFDKGYKTAVSESGWGIQYDGPKGEENLHDLMTFLLKAQSYTEWVIKVEAALFSATRPPFFDADSYGDVDGRVRGWVGTAAEAYLEAWKNHRYNELAGAAVLAEQVPADSSGFHAALDLALGLEPSLVNQLPG